MTFNDEDLKRLKDVLAVGTTPAKAKGVFLGTYLALDGQRFCEIFSALLARLEAAEAMIPERPPFAPPCKTFIEQGRCEDCDRYEAWRKAAGK